MLDKCMVILKYVEWYSIMSSLLFKILFDNIKMIAISD